MFILLFFKLLINSRLIEHFTIMPGCVITYGLLLVASAVNYCTSFYPPDSPLVTFNDNCLISHQLLLLVHVSLLVPRRLTLSRQGRGFYVTFLALLLIGGVELNPGPTVSGTPGYQLHTPTCLRGALLNTRSCVNKEL